MRYHEENQKGRVSSASETVWSALRPSNFVLVAPPTARFDTLKHLLQVDERLRFFYLYYLQ